VSTEVSRIEEIPPDLLHRYVEMRHKLDAEASSIFNITSMLALFDNCGDDKLEVDPVALGKLNQTLNSNILNIWEILDDFIYLVQAKLELEKRQQFTSKMD
jgi:hypothetical protein